jgi:two-component sensor histidine kinase/PAS domain-containing protein
MSVDPTPPLFESSGVGLEPDHGLDLDLDAWRDRVLRRMLPVLVIVAGIAAAGGVGVSILVHRYEIAVFDAVAWLAMVYLWRGALPYRARASAVVGLNFMVGTVILGLLGPSGVGYLWLAVAPITAALLFGRRAFLGWLIACEIVLVGFAVASHWFELGPTGALGVLWWLLVMAGVASLSLFTSLPTLDLLDGLAASLAVRSRSRDFARQQRHHEAALRSQFELLFNESPAALLLVGADGVVVRGNRLARQLFDLDLATVPIGALLGDVAAAATRAMCEPGDPSMSVFDELVYGRSATGRPRVVAVRISPIRIGATHHALVGAVDEGERMATQQALQHALDEKVTLLREVHHRVKNNLQIVSSLLDMQSDRVVSPEARGALLDSTHRVRAMAAIHQQLYAGDTFSRIDFGAYTRRLVEDLCGALAPDAQVTFALSTVEIPLADALPCGLILNELVTNALKHGRSGDGACRLAVGVRAVDERLEVEVRDAGAGLVTPWRELGRTSLGGRVIGALVRQLRATFDAGDADGGGARFRLVCPIQPVARSVG